MACVDREPADPRSVVREYRAAVERRDAQALHAMLTQRDRERLGRSGVRERLIEGGGEVQNSAVAVSSSDAVVRVEAEFTTPRGVPVSVVTQRGGYHVGAAGALPPRPVSPEQALALLRDALERRDYERLLRILSGASATSLEEELTSIADGLEDIDRLDIRVDGAAADVIVPGGHRVRLRREGDVWKVEDFE